MKYLLIFVFCAGCTTANLRYQSVMVNQSSGTRIDAYVVTANHVAKEDLVILTDFDGKERVGLVTMRDTVNDIALISEPNGRKYDFKTGPIRIGDKVYGMGTPLELTFSYMEGYVQHLNRREVNGRQYYQVAIDAGYGASGTVLFNGRGEMVGMIVAAIPSTRFTFIVPAKHIVHLINKANERR